MTELIELSPSDIKAIEKIESDADSFSKEKVEIYNKYRQTLSTECLKYIGVRLELPEVIELGRIYMGEGDKFQIYSGTQFIAHGVRDAWMSVKQNKPEDARSFFYKPLGIFNICDFANDEDLNPMLNIVGVTLIDDGQNYVEEFPYVPYFYIASEDVFYVNTHYILVPLSRLTASSNKSSIINTVKEIYDNYMSDISRIGARIRNYKVNRVVEKYPSSW